ncbi:hypothetical protein HNY73_017698 [Argiope bruennichi]|uniref:Uncharacterized protein n=1 Tax=Argiope bruennichi TaxID=94029 RepID=A0A8T0EBP8_ARGBR|nr:hypothetical protein HNY73_017698 [Argiope bruennichi]
MKYLLLSFVATVIVFHLSSAQLSKRCQSVCSRSDGQEFCQRCRMRVPMRFGKRVDPTPTDSGDDANDSSQPIPLQRDRDDGRYDDSSRLIGNKNLRVESSLLLNSMRNFARDLEDWDREVYDQ